MGASTRRGGICLGMHFRHYFILAKKKKTIENPRVIMFALQGLGKGNGSGKREAKIEGVVKVKIRIPVLRLKWARRLSGTGLPILLLLFP